MSNGIGFGYIEEKAGYVYSYGEEGAKKKEFLYLLRSCAICK